MKRSWTDARAKLLAEGGRCRVCRSNRNVQASHVIGRTHDREPPLRWDGDPFGWAEPYPVHPDRIVPLCERCHKDYDEHRRDLLPYLLVDEELQAVSDAGSLHAAWMRVSGQREPVAA